MSSLEPGAEPAPKNVIEDDINAAARVIGDISVGIYRSPANALKELVSNAFDAGATEVYISTDHPAFSSVSCYDNGSGMSVADLRSVLRFIGGSEKRLATDVGEFGRPVIGRIGIGILAMSQISRKFVIISTRRGDSYRLEAEVNIEQFVTDEAARTNLGTGKIGRYRIYTIPEPAETHFTIVATPGGAENLRQNLGPGKSPREYFATQREDAPPTFREFVMALREGGQGKPPVTMRSYDSFIWELAALCPVSYFDDGPVAGWTGWDEVKSQLSSYDFTVTVDGYDLRKPVVLPTADDLTEAEIDYKVYPFSYSDGDRLGLSFAGYIFHQRKQISPPELQGLLLRIRNVGIGGYDTSLLKYPRNLGPMVRGMTGEVFIKSGLEEALNIDRNSFNETHDHFLKLKDVLFKHLGTPQQPGITKDIRERSRNYRTGLQVNKTAEAFIKLRRRLERATGKKWEWTLDHNTDAPLRVIPPATISVNPEHDTVPSGTSARTEFWRVYLAVALLQALGDPPGSRGLVGWLRKL